VSLDFCRGATEITGDSQTDCPSRRHRTESAVRGSDTVSAWCTARGSIRYVGGISPPDGREGQSACSSATSTSSQTTRASPRSLPESPFECPQGPILTRIGPHGRGRKPPLTCGDAVEPPIGIEPMTYSLRGSYTHRKHSTGRHLPCQPRQRSRVSLTGSKSCMPKIRPRQKQLAVSTDAVQR
jgi:hypothetical protein